MHEEKEVEGKDEKEDVFERFYAVEECHLVGRDNYSVT